MGMEWSGELNAVRGYGGSGAGGWVGWGVVGVGGGGSSSPSSAGCSGRQNKENYCVNPYRLGIMEWGLGIVLRSPVVENRCCNHEIFCPHATTPLPRVT